MVRRRTRPDDRKRAEFLLPRLQSECDRERMTNPFGIDVPSGWVSKGETE